MLIIWTGAKINEIKNVFGPIISTYNIPHAIHSDTTTPPEVDDGDVVLACGTKILEVIQNLELAPKKRTVTSMRETAIPASGANIFITFDPSIVNKDYARLPDLQWDCHLACRQHVHGHTKPVLGQYDYVESLHNIINRIEEKYEATGSPVEVASDLETLGLDEYLPNAWIISVSFTVDTGKSEVVYFDKDEKLEIPPPFLDIDEMNYWQALWSQIHWIMTTPKVSMRGANFKFDSRWMNHKWGIYCTNHRFDTLLVGSLLDENRSNSLKLHAKIYTPLGGYEDDAKQYDFSRVDLIPKDVLLPYAGGDTDATYQVAVAQKKELIREKGLANFYVNLMHPASKVFEKLETNGIVVDVPYYQELRTQLEVETTRLQHDMVAMLPAILREKHKDKIQEAFDEGKNPMGAKLLKDFLFTEEGLGLKPQMVTEKTKEPSTALDHLIMFADNPDAKQFIDVFTEYGSAKKTLSTYVVGFLSHLRSDNRFHPHFMLFRGGYGDDDTDAGAVTGRTSAKDPAVQTIPKHTKWTKKLRRAFIAPEGYTILQCDYSQGELKIAACVAEEPTMIDAYLNGIDLHAVTAAQLTGYEMGEFMLLPEDERDALRSLGKAGNFGLLYGMGANGFREYAKASYGVSMTEQDAAKKRDAFFALYSRLPEWHEEYRNWARKDLRVISPLGRVRHLPLINSSNSEVRAQAERQSINSPIQSCLSDLMQLAMVELDKEYGQRIVQMCLMTHDSLAMYVPIGEEMLWARRVTDVMSNLPITRLFGWKPQLQFTADAECSMPDDDGVRSLASLKKLKGY